MNKKMEKRKKGAALCMTAVLAATMPQQEAPSEPAQPSIWKIRGSTLYPV